MSMTTESQSDVPATERDASRSIGVGAGESDASQFLAQRLHELGYIYALYGALDGMSLSYSMLKYLFDLRYTTSNVFSSDMMHEWMLTPAGIAAITAESITIIGFSILASVYDEKDATNAFKQQISIIWPYCRETMKGLKNAYKGVRSTVQVAGLFTDLDLRNMIVPAGLLLGVFASANRIWYRSMRNERKEMMKVNEAFLKNVFSSACLDDEIKTFCAAKVKQDKFLTDTQYMGLATQVYSGFIDGLYLYMGVMSLATLAPAVSAAMSISCVLFVSMCIVTRVYEEYEYQRMLKISQGKVELAILGKELEATFETFWATLRSPIILTDHQQRDAYALFMAKLGEFEVRREQQRELLRRSYTSAAISGLKNGMAAYGVIASFLFALATIAAILVVPLPPMFLIMSTIAGIACLISFMAHALYENHLYLTSQQEASASSKKSETEMTPHEKFTLFLENMKRTPNDINASLKPDTVKKDIFNGLLLDPSPQFFVQEWCEVARSFFSGVAKGQKWVDYALNPLQEADERGHYHDTPTLNYLTILCSTTFTLGLALRAHVKAFGRPALVDSEVYSKILGAPTACELPAKAAEAVESNPPASRGIPDVVTDLDEPPVDGTPKSLSVLEDGEVVPELPDNNRHSPRLFRSITPDPQPVSVSISGHSFFQLQRSASANGIPVNLQRAVVSVQQGYTAPDLV